MSRWLRGEALPTQNKLLVLSELLHVDPQVLRFGSSVQHEVRERDERWAQGAGYLERETFDAFDKDGSGTIGIEEFGRLLKLLGAGMKPQDLRIGFRELDRDGSGAIGFEEFYAWWTDQ